MYNTIVCIGNIIIKFYKIEAKREVCVTWTEVASSSGGEGFLLASVELCSLMSLMRRNETGLLSSFNEGKVLAMDNPFAQTNAEYLLKPLIEMVNRNNTQLICFSGLGEDFILNRFDNTYVLTPIPSKLRDGLEMIQSEHVKEIEYEKMVASRIYTGEVEQIKLF